MRARHLLFASVLSIGSLAEAQTVSVPPVEISVLTHQHQVYGGSPPYTSTSDSVRFPCTAGDCNGPGFTASIGTGDTIVVRFEAPAGSRFAVTRAPFGTQDLIAQGRWRVTGSTDPGSNLATPTTTFENLVGGAPPLTQSANFVSDLGQVVQVQNTFQVDHDFSFTALEVRFTVGHPLARMSRTYDPIDVGGALGFGSHRLIVGSQQGDATLMTIEPIPPGPFCFGDGTGTPCPCANSGSPGRGCQNSSTTGGARLTGTGTSSPDTMVLSADGEKPTAITIFLQGTRTNGVVAFGDGLRCVQGVLKRLYTKTAVGGAVSAPEAGDPSITARSAQLGDPIAPGSTRYYMTYYRDGVSSFCPLPTGNSFNGSNGWVILW